MTTLRQRLAKIEGAADGPKGPPRIIVRYPGDPPYEAPEGDDDNWVVFRVVYDDTPPTREGENEPTTTTDAS